jgi:hypothetical protein
VELFDEVDEVEAAVMLNSLPALVSARQPQTAAYSAPNAGRVPVPPHLDAVYDYLAAAGNTPATYSHSSDGVVPLPMSPEHNEADNPSLVTGRTYNQNPSKSSAGASASPPLRFRSTIPFAPAVETIYEMDLDKDVLSSARRAEKRSVTLNPIKSPSKRILLPASSALPEVGSPVFTSDVRRLAPVRAPSRGTMGLTSRLSLRNVFDDLEEA